MCHISLGLCVLTHKLIPNAVKKWGEKQLTQEVDLISFSSSYSCSSVSKIVEVNSSSSFFFSSLLSFSFPVVYLRISLVLQAVSLLSVCFVHLSVYQFEPFTVRRSAV